MQRKMFFANSDNNVFANSDNIRMLQPPAEGEGEGWQERSGANFRKENISITLYCSRTGLRKALLVLVVLSVLAGVVGQGNKVGRPAC